MGSRQDRLKKVGKECQVSERVGQLDKTADQRKYSEHNKGQVNRPSRVMTEMAFRFTEKSEEHHASGVYRCNERSNQSCKEETGIAIFRGKRQPEDLVLAVKSRSYQRNRSERSRANEKRPIDDRQFCS